MYTVSKGPSKLVAKTRRGIPQNYEKYELLRDLGRKTNDEYDISSELRRVFRQLEKLPSLKKQHRSVPRPVFQTSKKSAAAQYVKLQQQQQKQLKSEQEIVSPQHEELIKYINDSWNMVVAANPYDVPGSPNSTGSNCSLSSNSSTSSASSNTSTSTMYYNEPPSPVLVDFQPFDLETWWGKRIFNSITKSL